MIRSTSCSCSSCSFGLVFQHQNLQDLIKRIKALIKVIFLKASKQSDVRDRGLHNSLPITYCRISLPCVDFVAQKKFRGYNNLLVATFALTLYPQMYPLNTKCSSKDVVKTRVETWFQDLQRSQRDVLR